MMFSALSFLAVVQLANAQDVFIPASQLRGSTDSSLGVPVDTMMQNMSLPHMNLSADTASGWGWYCNMASAKGRRTISRGSLSSGVCDYKGQGFDGDKKLSVFAWIRSTNNDALQFAVEIGHMEPGRGCVFEGKAIPGFNSHCRYSWDYPYANAFQWKKISYDIPHSDNGQFKRTCMKYELVCVTPYKGHDECHVEVDKIELGESSRFR